MGFDAFPAAALLEGFPEPFVMIDQDGSILAINSAGAALLKGDAEALRGQSILRFLPEEERGRLNPLQWLQRWAEQPEAAELRYVHLICRDLDGSHIPVRVRVGRIAGDPSKYLVLLQDISAEQARQQQSRQAHRLAARVLAISADAIVNVDASGAITWANPGAEQLFGYGPGELLNRPLAALMPVRFRTAHAAHMGHFANDPRPSRLMGERGEVLGLTATGEEIPLEASITKVTLDRERIFSAHLRDLRPRKAAAAALAHADAGLRTVFEHAQQAMAIIRPDGTVQAMNRAGRALLPAGAEVVGAAFATLPFWSRDAASAAEVLQGAIDRCLQGAAFRTLARLTLADGTERDLDLSLWPVMSEGRVFAIIADARDPAAAQD